MPETLLGPLGLLVGAILAVGYLVRILREYLDDIKRQRDEAIAGWKAQTTATDRLANAIEIRNRRDSKRTRAEDEP